MTINRRTFQISLMLAICGSALSTLAGAQSAQRAVYRHRFRFSRRGQKLDFWLRVVNVKDVSADVPFTLLISSDAAGQNVLKRISHVSHALSSHISRGSIDLSVVSPNLRSPLYGQMIFSEGNLSTKVRQINSQVGPSPV